MSSFLKFLLTHKNLFNAMDQKIFQNSVKISAEARVEILVDGRVSFLQTFLLSAK